MFSSQNLSSNLKKLDQYYQKKLTPNELDERHFINAENRNMTPFKLSPFARENYMHKRVPPTPTKLHPHITVSNEDEDLEPPHKRVLNSSRVLNYEP